MANQKRRRRDHKIRHWRPNDKAALRMVALCGHGNLDDFRKLRISEKRVLDMTRPQCGILEKFEVMRKGEIIEAYHLTDKGRKFVDQELGIGYSMKSTAKTYGHNEKLKVTLIELKRSGKEIARIWNERELLKRYEDEIQAARDCGENIGAVDSMIEYADGSMQCIEITTRFYSQETIAGKANFAALIGGKIVFYKA